MAISRDERAFLRTLYSRLKDEPLEPNSPYYKPVHERLKLEDPVKKIETLIEFDGIESIRLFSGFRGSGKTTELNRLRKVLEDQGYFVLYADALNYVNPAEPIDITDLLMVLAGAFSDALEDQLKVRGNQCAHPRSGSDLHRLRQRGGDAQRPGAGRGNSLAQQRGRDVGKCVGLHVDT